MFLALRDILDEFFWRILFFSLKSTQVVLLSSISFYQILFDHILSFI